MTQCVHIVNHFSKEVLSLHSTLEYGCTEHHIICILFFFPYCTTNFIPQLTVICLQSLKKICNFTQGKKNEGQMKLDTWFSIALSFTEFLINRSRLDYQGTVMSGFVMFLFLSCISEEKLLISVISLNATFSPLSTFKKRSRPVEVSVKVPWCTHSADQCSNSKRKLVI